MNIPNSPSVLGLGGNLGPGTEGAKSVGPLNYPWDVLASQPINLSALQSQANLISQVQALYIDNSANTNPVTLVLANLQRIVFPAKSQGYIPALMGTPVIFTASSVVAAGQKTAIFLLNYAVDSIIWSVA